MENKEIRLINLRKLLREAKTAAALADAANTSPAYISQILSSKTKGSIGNRLARKLEVAAGKPNGWLDTLHNDTEQPKFQVKHIPFMELDKITEWHMGDIWMPNKTIHITVEDNQAFGDDVFCIEMTGDAMVSSQNIEASICAGDTLLIDQRLTPEVNDIVLAKIQNIAKIRQLTKDGNELILKAFSPQYPIIPFDENAVKILGVVFEIRRKIKKRVGSGQQGISDTTLFTEEVK